MKWNRASCCPVFGILPVAWTRPIPTYRNERCVLGPALWILCTSTTALQNAEYHFFINLEGIRAWILLHNQVIIFQFSVTQRSTSKAQQLPDLLLKSPWGNVNTFQGLTANNSYELFIKSIKIKIHKRTSHYIKTQYINRDIWSTHNWSRIKVTATAIQSWPCLGPFEF